MSGAGGAPRMWSLSFSFKGKEAEKQAFKSDASVILLGRPILAYCLVICESHEIVLIILFQP